MSTVISPDNPFLRLPQSFDPDHYYGSQAWVDVALLGISGTPTRSMELIGLPGMGKSFLLRYLADREGALKKNDHALQHPYDKSPDSVFPLLVEFRLLPSDTHPFLYLFRRFHDEFKKYRKGKGAVPCRSLPERLGADHEPQLPGQATAAVEEVLLKLKEAGVRTAFLFDDFHLAFKLLSQEETTRLRPWREAAAFILATERRLDKVNSEAAGSPFYQTLQVVPFGGLSGDEARRLLSEPAKDAGWPFSPDDVEFAVAQAGGHPLLLILAGRAIWDSRNSLQYTKGKRTAVSKEYPTMLLGRFKGWFRPTFQMYWEHLEPEEQSALSAAAGAAKTLREHDLSLSFLEQLGLLRFDQKEDRYVPFSPLFTEYVKEKTQTTEKAEKANGVSGIEANLLNYLRRHMNRPTPFDELAREVWGKRTEGVEDVELVRRRVQVAVSRLRKKLHESGRGDIVSVRDKGYRLVSS
jgi:hypothetical protein